MMAQTMINFRLDSELKKSMEEACKEMGISITTAFKIFATKVGRERKIPFEVSADPFYSEENMAHLRKAVAALNAGEGLIEKTMEELKAMEEDE